MVKIREAKIDDLFAIADMWMTMRQDEMKSFKMSLDGHERERFILQTMPRLYLANWKYFVADDDGELKGFISGEIGLMNYTSVSVGSCKDLYVKPEHRDRKVGHLLMTELYKWGEDSGSKIIKFQTMYDEKIIKRWEGMGWTPLVVIYKKEFNKEVNNG